MASPHAVAVREAERLTRKLAEIFGKLGTAEHPRGAMLTAYRTAIRALSGHLDQPGVVEDALRSLRRELQSAMVEYLDLAVEEAEAAVRKVLAANGLPQVAAQSDNGLFVQAWIQTVDEQTQKVRIAAATRMLNESAILGDNNRVGVLTPAPVIRDSARWIVGAANKHYDDIANAAIAEAKADYRRQAVAAIDERTTDCCLRVHGQLTGLDEPFQLRGTPRFADEMDQPPFHWYCRTAVALVPREEAEDELTEKMRSARDKELQFRERAREAQKELEAKLVELGAEPDIRIRKDDSGKVKEIRRELREWRNKEREEIHPASATSGRS